MNLFHLRALSLPVFVALLAAATAHPQTYPTRPVRLVVISAPGGTTDILSRVYAQHLSEALGQPVVLDNRPGAGGIIAAEIVATANPDGHTLLWTHVSHSVLPSLHKKLPFEPIKDFAPISLAALFPDVLIVNNAVPARTVKELIALAKAQPGKINYASGTTGSSSHLSGQLLKLMANVNLVQVPYKGTAGQLASVIGGETQMTFASLPAALPHVRAGRVRALAMGSAKRTPVLPDVPTVAESALPGFDVSAWNGMLAPRKTPPGIVSRLNAEMRRIAENSEAKERAAAQGAELTWQTPEEFEAFLTAQIAKWGKVVRAAGVRPD